MRPLAESATTASAGPTPAAAMSPAPARPSSSAASCATAWAWAPARDDRQDPAVGQAERRPALGRVDEREPAGRAGADVDQPAAAGHALDDRLDRRRERGGGLADGGRDARVLVVDELDELEGRAQVDVGVQGLALLGDGLGASHDRGV